MKKSIIIFICVVTLLTTGCQNIPILENGQEAIITYDGGSISADEFYEILKNKYGRDVLIEMIDTALLNLKFPDDSEYDSLVDSQVTYFKTQTGDDFLSTIKYYYGLNSEEELRDFILLSYKQEALVEEYIKESFSDNDISNFYDEKIYGDITASHILITPVPEDSTSSTSIAEAEEEAYVKALEIIERLNNGEDFAELAEELSDDSGSASDGGNIGTYNISSNFVDEFKEGGVDLEVGSYTIEPVKSDYGYHIILKVSQDEKPDLDDVLEIILDILYTEVIEEDYYISYKILEQFRIDMGVDIYDDNLLDQYNIFMNEINSY